MQELEEDEEDDEDEENDEECDDQDRRQRSPGSARHAHAQLLKIAAGCQNTTPAAEVWHLKKSPRLNSGNDLQSPSIVSQLAVGNLEPRNDHVVNFVIIHY